MGYRVTRVLLWLIAVLAVPVGCWRIGVGISTDDLGGNERGRASRVHKSLLLWQGALAFVGAYAAFLAAIDLTADDRRSARFPLALLVIVLLAFLAIFLKSGLTDFGPYES